MKILLLGLGRFGSAIAEKLLSQEHEVWVVEIDPSVVEDFLNRIEQKGLNLNLLKVCVGDAASLLVWEYLPVKSMDLIISSLRGEVFNKKICELVRQIYRNYEVPVLVLSFGNLKEETFANFNCKVINLPT